MNGYRSGSNASMSSCKSSGNSNSNSNNGQSARTNAINNIMKLIKKTKVGSKKKRKQIGMRAGNFLSLQKPRKPRKPRKPKSINTGMASRFSLRKGKAPIFYTPSLKKSDISKKKGNCKPKQVAKKSKPKQAVPSSSMGAGPSTGRQTLSNENKYYDEKFRKTMKKVYLNFRNGKLKFVPSPRQLSYIAPSFNKFKQIRNGTLKPSLNEYDAWARNNVSNQTANLLKLLGM